MDEPDIPTSTSPTAKRRWAMVLFVAAVVLIAWSATQLSQLLGHQPYEVDDFIGPVFALIFGLFLLAASRAARRPDTKLTLPPDNHIHH